MGAGVGWGGKRGRGWGWEGGWWVALIKKPHAPIYQSKFGRGRWRWGGLGPAPPTHPPNKKTVEFNGFFPHFFRFFSFFFRFFLFFLVARPDLRVGLLWARVVCREKEREEVPKKKKEKKKISSKQLYSARAIRSEHLPLAVELRTSSGPKKNKKKNSVKDQENNSVTTR